jgi:hypothetical protein
VFAGLINLPIDERTVVRVARAPAVP